MKYVALILLAIYADFSLANAQLEIAKDQARIKMLERENKLAANKSKMASLKIEPIEITPKNYKQLNFGSKLLTCQASSFSWPIANFNSEIKDCTFKLNIANESEIQMFYATLNKMNSDGWKVDKNEVFNQDIQSPERIINIERWRFTKSNKL